MKKFSLEKSILINAPVSKVWDALVNPSMIKKYLYGTDAVSEWTEGSELIFKGEWEGKTYIDKGKILILIPEKILKYTYFSSFSEMEEKEENYQIITNKLVPEGSKTRLTLTQENISSEESKKHSEENWEYVLNVMKDLVEKNK